MFWNSKWRAICSEGWDERDARVVCRQLNYLATSLEVKGTIDLLYSRHVIVDVIVVTSHHGSVFKLRTSVLLTNVGCNGTERNIPECCAKETNTNSLHCHSTAGVQCKYNNNGIMY